MPHDEHKNRPGTAVGTGAISSLTANRTEVRLGNQPDEVIYDDLFGHVSEGPALDMLISEPSPGDLEKSELLRQAADAVFSQVNWLRERGSKVTPAQLEKHLLTMLNESIAAHKYIIRRRETVSRAIRSCRRHCLLRSWRSSATSYSSAREHRKTL